MLSQDLFNRYLKNQCTAQEREIVEQYLAAHEDELDQLLPQSELEQFNNQQLDPAISGRIFTQVDPGINKVKRINIWKPLAVAASLLVFLSIALLLYKQNRSADVPTKIAAVKPLFDTVNNTGNSVMDVTLSDGSVISLAAHSSIRYSARLQQQPQRLIYLEGEALFRVAKDKARPFTVITALLRTTALGTSFTVTSRKDEPLIRVRLHTGKVVVNTDKPYHDRGTQAIYLLPGDELQVNTQTMLASLKLAKKRMPVMAAAKRKHYTVVEQPSWYEFQGQALADVIDQLSTYYATDISYKPADMRNKYFIGSFTKGANLDLILKDIATLNNLTLTKQDNSYLLTKKR